MSRVCCWKREQMPAVWPKKWTSRRCRKPSSSSSMRWPYTTTPDLRRRASRRLSRPRVGAGMEWRGHRDERRLLRPAVALRLHSTAAVEADATNAAEAAFCFRRTGPRGTHRRRGVEKRLRVSKTCSGATKSKSTRPGLALDFAPWDKQAGEAPRTSPRARAPRLRNEWRRPRRHPPAHRQRGECARLGHVLDELQVLRQDRVRNTRPFRED